MEHLAFELCFAVTGLAEFVATFWRALKRVAARLDVAYLGAAAAMASLAWAVYRWRGETQRSLVDFLFPRRVWLNPSALLDYRFIVVDRTLIALVISAAATAGLIETAEGLSRDLTWSDPAAPSVLVAYTIVLLLTEDFFRYWMHRWMHTVPWLWEFHKVHHSSIVLTPFSLYRSHPVNSMLNAARSSAAVLVVTWVFASAFPGELSVLSILGVNAGRFLFNVLGGNLRHSHVWISFGRYLSHVFISPAMHQLHHSALPHHWGRNFGSQLAIWDWLFGTLLVPARRENLRIGLGPGGSRGYKSVADLYLAPFRGLAAVRSAG